MDRNEYHRPPTLTRPAGHARLAGRLLGLCLGVSLLTACVTGPPVYQSPRRGTVSLGPTSAGPGPATTTPTGSERPALAVLTLVDARPAFHREALPSYLREQGGWTGEAPTRESAWAAPLASLATDDLVARLEASGHFSRVERVEVVGAVPADALLLRGRLRRLRGYQGYHVERGAPPELVVNLGEAYLDELELGDPRSRKLLFLGQAGAAVEGAEVLDPFALARAAWAEAADSLVARLGEADLSATLEREVSLPAEARGDLASLLGALPGAWEEDAAAPMAQPPGWRGAGDCRAVALVDPSRTFYQPQLGHYRPTLRLWLCSPQVHLELRLSDDGPRFPAELTGSLAGAPVLTLSLGKSSWPGAPAQILRYLDAETLAGPILRWPMEARSEGEPVEAPVEEGAEGPVREPISPRGGGAAPAP